jgi:hypothetical protein
MARLLAPVAVAAVVGCGRIDYAGVGDPSIDAGGVGDPSNDAGGVGVGDGSIDGAPPPGFCASQPPVTFCSDFDDGTGTDPWIDAPIIEGGALAVEPVGRSSPFALVSTSPEIGSGATARAWIGRRLGVSGKRVRLGFDARIEQAGGSDAALLYLGLDDGEVVHEIEYLYREPPAAAYMEEFRTVGAGPMMFDSYALPASFPVGEWHRIGVEIETVPSGRLVVTHDGVLQLDTALAGSSSGAVRFGVGLVYLAGPDSAWRVEIDNAWIVVE